MTTPNGLIGTNCEHVVDVIRDCNFVGWNMKVDRVYATVARNINHMENKWVSAFVAERFGVQIVSK